MLNDQVVIHVRGKKVTFLRKAFHPLERDGSARVMTAKVRPGYEGATDVCLSYLVAGHVVMPVWEVHAERRVCLLDARSGEVLDAHGR